MVRGRVITSRYFPAASVDPSYFAITTRLLFVNSANLEGEHFSAGLLRCIGGRVLRAKMNFGSPMRDGRYP